MSQASYSMSKFSVKIAHQIHLWEGIDFELKINVLFTFFKSQVLQVNIFYILRVIEETVDFDYNAVMS